jgi:8-oxo-dGTP pyrophosphatase MutT (NUDIX family)
MNLFSAIKKELLSDLPGSETQRKLAPAGREIASPQNIQENAAVAIIIISSTEKMEIVFTKRTVYNGHHSGQISFPGGKAEANDHSLVETAIRESHEEIGVKIRKQDLLGKLTSLFIPVSGFKVQPFVFSCPIKNKLEFIIDHHEVEYVFLCTIQDLFRENLIHTTQLELENSLVISTPYYAIKNEMVWGATAMILSEFIAILKGVKKKYPGIL